MSTPAMSKVYKLKWRLIFKEIAVATIFHCYFQITLAVIVAIKFNSNLPSLVVASIDNKLSMYCCVVGYHHGAAVGNHAQLRASIMYLHQRGVDRPLSDLLATDIVLNSTSCAFYA